MNEDLEKSLEKLSGEFDSLDLTFHEFRENGIDYRKSFSRVPGTRISSSAYTGERISTNPFTVRIFSFLIMDIGEITQRSARIQTI